MAQCHELRGVGHRPEDADAAASVPALYPAHAGLHPAGAGLPHTAAGESGAAVGLWPVHRRRRHAQRRHGAGGAAGGGGVDACLCGYGADAGDADRPVAGHGGRIPRRRCGEACRARCRSTGCLLRGTDGAGHDRSGGLAAGAAGAGGVPCDPAESGEAHPLAGGHRLRRPRRAGAPFDDDDAVGVSGRDAGGGDTGHAAGAAVSHGLAGASGYAAGRDDRSCWRWVCRRMCWTT